jgi:uncharacterized membrane protein HdeD (DUF308 family)
MSPITVGPAVTTQEELRRIQSSWGWFLALGLLLVVLGTVAIGYSCLVEITEAAVWLFGWLLLAGGVAEILHAFRVSRWSGTLLHVLIGVLYIVVGFMTIDNPLGQAILLTRFIAIFLMIGGLFRIFASLVQQFPGWGAVLLNGIVSLVLGGMIYKGWPSSGLWFIGLYIGIEMIMNGWAWIFLSLGLKRLPVETAPS